MEKNKVINKNSLLDKNDFFQSHIFLFPIESSLNKYN